MSGTKEELVRSWFIKAHRDLLSAHELASIQMPLLDTAAYHCQQAAEKAVKGFLLFHHGKFVLKRNQAKAQEFPVIFR